MEHLFRRHNYALFSEFKEFSFYFAKATTSFAKLSWSLTCLTVFCIRSLGHLLFVGPSLYKRHSPYESTIVEKSAPLHFPKSF